MDLKINWFIPVEHRDYNHMPASVWIRCLQLIPYLQKHGIRCRINDPEAGADIAVFVRWQDDKAYETLRKQKDKSRKVIFDLCVNYFDETGLFLGGYGTASEQVKEALRMVNESDAITCASAFIAKRASNFHNNVFYLPDSVDRRHFSLTKSNRDFTRSAPRAVWSGVASKAIELNGLGAMLGQRKIPLIIISERPPDLQYPYSFVRWSYRLFPKSILQGDLCISPRRTDNPYDLGHSIFKIGVFLAQGVPALAAPIPSYIELLGDGQCGQICASQEEWSDVLDRVLANRKLLEEWSLAGRARMQKYATVYVAEQYIQLFQKLMDVSR